MQDPKGDGERLYVARRGFGAISKGSCSAVAGFPRAAAVGFLVLPPPLPASAASSAATLLQQFSQVLCQGERRCALKVPVLLRRCKFSKGGEARL